MSRKMRKFLRQVSAKKHTVGALTVFVLMLVVAFSSMIIIMPETVKAAPSSWWNSDWSYSKKIIIDSTKVTGDLTNFPYLFYNVSSDFASHARADGYDFRFVNETNETEYYFEIENYTSATGSLTAWVNITSLSSSSDTVLWVYYGNASASSDPSNTSTWDSHYRGVWHMDNASGAIQDSTSNDEDSILTEGDPTYNSTGIVGYGVNYDSNDRHKLPNDMVSTVGMEAGYTLEAWVNFDTLSENQFVFTIGYHALTYMTYGHTKQKMRFYAADAADVAASDIYSETTITTSTWYYFAGAFDGAGGHSGSSNTALYLDAVNENSSTVIGMRDVASINPIGGSTGGVPDYGAQGIIDEVRITVGAYRTHDWINATYNTINSPSTFATYGTEQQEQGGTSSSFSLKGVSSPYALTFAGTAGTTVYCNATGDSNEWAEINMTINATDNVTEIRVWIGDLNDTSAFINASNMSLYISSDNSSYGLLGTFTDGGSNLSINSSNWVDVTMGTNPFNETGLKDKNDSIWFIVKLTFPATLSTDIFYSVSTTAWKVHIGYFA